MSLIIVFDSFVHEISLESLNKEEPSSNQLIPKTDAVINKSDHPDEKEMYAYPTESSDITTKTNESIDPSDPRQTLFYDANGHMVSENTSTSQADPALTSAYLNLQQIPQQHFSDTKQKTSIPCNDKKDNSIVDNSNLLSILTSPMKTASENYSNSSDMNASITSPSKVISPTSASSITSSSSSLSRAPSKKGPPILGSKPKAGVATTNKQSGRTSMVSVTETVDSNSISSQMDKEEKVITMPAILPSLDNVPETKEILDTNSTQSQKSQKSIENILPTPLPTDDYKKQMIQVSPSSSSLNAKETVSANIIPSDREQLDSNSQRKSNNQTLSRSGSSNSFRQELSEKNKSTQILRQPNSETKLISHISDLKHNDVDILLEMDSLSKDRSGSLSHATKERPKKNGTRRPSIRKLVADVFNSTLGHSLSHSHGTSQERFSTGSSAGDISNKNIGKTVSVIIIQQRSIYPFANFFLFFSK